MQGWNMLVALVSFFRCFLYLEAVDGDILVVGQLLSSNNTLVSNGGIFELGFFTPGSSMKEYIGVWYKQSEKQTVIWVANRESPVVKTPGTLTLREHGVLEISDSESEIIWSSNSTESVLNPVAQLLDSGNFVIKSGNKNARGLFAWQGFDYPCDTRVPGMKIGYDVRKKRNVYLSSWKSLDDPAEGRYSFKLDITGIPQYFYENGTQEIFRLGAWNGQAFSGTPDIRPDKFYRISYTSDDEWIYFELEPINSPGLSRTVLGVNGSWLLLIGYNDNLVQNMTRDYVTQKCDEYNYCGSYATCDTNKLPVCECLIGYVPKFQREWDMADWTNGCVKTTNCSTGDKFVKLSSIKIPDTRNAYGNMTWSLKECKMACLENCSCTAYGIWNVTQNGTSCLLWFGELKDIRVYQENGQDIFIRGDGSDIGPGVNVKVIMKASIVSSLVLLAVIALIICYRKRRASKKPQSGHKNEILEIPLFDFETMCMATNNFSAENKLGEGGFGPVYKGTLRGGQEIAVKKLSHNSKQGSIEFRNEVMCIAKLRHRNLVKLLGCCNQVHYMLIYEYMPNKSLDFFIFDEKNRALLDWPKRSNIIHGIARGLLYLHQDSQLIVIHRDLKSSNVLLDCDMNPKISDFGMARIFESSEATANTTRVVGTYGYMSPEYAIEGRFSIKSDVFSFGVMLLEIISGRRNKSFNHPDRYLNLLGHTWELFRQERFMEIVDEALTNFHDTTAEVIRAIHIGLLCVQELPRDRPDMARVVLMLSSDSSLPYPKPPGFFSMMKSVESGSSSSNHHLCSANQMSVTLMTPR